MTDTSSKEASASSLITQAMLDLLLAATASPPESERRYPLAIVAGSSRHADALAQQFGLNRATRANKSLRIIKPGQTMAGHRFAMVLLTEGYQRELYHGEDQLARWHKELMTRLAPNAPVIHL